MKKKPTPKPIQGDYAEMHFHVQSSGMDIQAQVTKDGHMQLMVSGHAKAFRRIVQDMGASIVPTIQQLASMHRPAASTPSPVPAAKKHRKMKKAKRAKRKAGPGSGGI